MTVKSCLHMACSCPVGPDDLYCTPACRRASERSDPFGEAGCDCGHEECLGHAGKRGQENRGKELQHPPQRRARA
jgi:hypothetical protein